MRQFRIPRMRPTSSSSTVNGWQKAQVIISAATPVVVALTAFALNWQFTERAARAAEEQNRINRWSSVSPLLTEITTGTRQEQAVAVALINAVLGTDAAAVLGAVAATPGVDATVQGKAQALADQRIAELTQQLFSLDRDVRSNAYQRLLDPDGPAYADVIPVVLAYANANMTNMDGVANVIRYLREISVITLDPFETEIRAFLARAAENGDTSTRLANDVLRKWD
ncbi:hypothetical protein [Devosia riboflavina]